LMTASVFSSTTTGSFLPGSSASAEANKHIEHRKQHQSFLVSGVANRKFRPGTAAIPLTPGFTGVLRTDDR